MIGDYRNKKRTAIVIPDNGGYDLYNGQMNPEIYKRFSLLLRERGESFAFEPYASSSGSSFQYFDANCISLYAYSLNPQNDKLIKADATKDVLCKPENVKVGGLIFHPPYYGSSPFSNHADEISNVTDVNDWLYKIKISANLAISSLYSDSLVCVVGRFYRYNNKQIRLDEWFVDIFSEKLTIKEVWSSIPDIAIIMEFKKTWNNE
jgi:hypothetical protein